MGRRTGVGWRGLRRTVALTAGPGRTGGDVRNLAEVIVAASIRQANDAGSSWRELGRRLAVPYPTLYRRYGRGEPTSVS